MGHLTNAQLLVLKAAIASETDPAFVESRTAGATGEMAAFFNAPSTMIVWRTSVSKKDCMANAAFDWTRIDNLTVGKARIWTELFSIGNIDASKPNIRLGIDATWVGSAPDLAVRAAVYVQCKRPASRLEKMFAVGTGTDAVPATLGIETSITSTHISEALAAV